MMIFGTKRFIDLLTGSCCNGVCSNANTAFVLPQTITFVFNQFIAILVLTPG